METPGSGGHQEDLVSGGLGKGKPILMVTGSVFGDFCRAGRSVICRLRIALILENKENKMTKALLTAICLVPTTVIAHPGSGMMHDSQHLLWLLAAAAVAAIGFLFREKI